MKNTNTQKKHSFNLVNVVKVIFAGIKAWFKEYNQAMKNYYSSKNTYHFAGEGFYFA